MARLELQVHVDLVKIPLSAEFADARRASLLLLSQTIMAANFSRPRSFHWIGAK